MRKKREILVSRTHDGEAVIDESVLYREESVLYRAGDSVLDCLRRKGIEVDTPCGGNGTCGKCRMDVLPRGGDEWSTALACQTAACDVARVNAPLAHCGPGQATAGFGRGDVRDRAFGLGPVARKPYAFAPPPQLGDVARGEDRPLAATERESIDASVLSASDAGRALGIACDVGTTTIAAYLYRLSDGGMLSSASCLNPQSAHGADVITRIDRARDESVARAMSGLVREAVDELAGRLIEYGRAAGFPCARKDVVAIVFAANTAMTHLVLGLPVSGLAIAPYTPVTLSAMSVPAGSLNLRLAKGATALTLPAASAYVGSDALAAALACGMCDDDGPNLLVDIGTNGEMVLGGNGRFLSCSAAAGPAFEGACISCGTACVRGAVYRVWIEQDRVRALTVDGAPPIGLCGSGLVDAVAEMLRIGVVTAGGRIMPVAEVGESREAAGLLQGLPKHALGRLQESRNAALSSVLTPLAAQAPRRFDAERSFTVVRKGEYNAVRDIAVTQKDIRELQNAKAAIAAAAKTLCEAYGCGLSGVRRVYLAGGFGTSVNVKSAVAIGLLPAELASKAVAVGNAAGAGAAEALLSRASYLKLEALGKSVECLELSTSAAFAEAFVGCMPFG